MDINVLKRVCVYVCHLLYIFSFWIEDERIGLWLFKHSVIFSFARLFMENSLFFAINQFLEDLFARVSIYLLEKKKPQICVYVLGVNCISSCIQSIVGISIDQKYLYTHNVFIARINRHNKMQYESYHVND